ncbi:hypothetical protein D3C75_973010 [compost metagenome]
MRIVDADANGQKEVDNLIQAFMRLIPDNRQPRRNDDTPRTDEFQMHQHVVSEPRFYPGNLSREIDRMEARLQISERRVRL